MKPDGSCVVCCFDTIRNESLFGNVFTDSWEEIGRRFREQWRRPNDACLRCDYWWNGLQFRGPLDFSWKEWTPEQRREMLKRWWDE